MFDSPTPFPTLECHKARLDKDGEGRWLRPFIPCFPWSDGSDQQEQVFVKDFKFSFEYPYMQ
jgi:hypothetical protein